MPVLNIVYQRINREGSSMTQRAVLPGLIHLFTFLSALFVNGSVFAHAQLLVEGETPPRYDTASLKNTAPCGNEANFANVKTDRISIFVSGETINVEWKETIQHSGQFYLDFSTTGINGAYNGLISIPDVGSASTWNSSYTFPNTSCRDCVLRMRQDMGNADISGHYFSCANIILVSGTDMVAPSNSTNVMTVVSGTNVNVNWTNPADLDYRSTIVVRSPTNLTAMPQVRKDYQVADLIGNGVVVYKGTAGQFNDTGLVANTSYTYSVFSYDDDYNYNTGAMTTATTDPISGGGGGSGGGVNAPSSSGSGGSLSGWWLLLVYPLWRRRQNNRG